MIKVFNKKEAAPRGNVEKKVEMKVETKVQADAEDQNKSRLSLVGDFAGDAERKMMQLLKEDGEMTHALSELLSGTEYTLDEIRQVEKQIMRLDDSIVMTNSSVEAVSKRLEDSSNVIENTREGYIHMAHKMDEVSEVFSDLRNLFEQLNLHYQEIQKFTNMITNVANQTRLLSLNASIEAARVGAAGAGFSVVANEIKKLSDESQKNATDIIGSLKLMTETINRLNEKSSGGSEVVTETKKMVTASEQLIDGIVEAENRVRDRVEEVKVSQNTNIEAIKKITDNLGNVAQKSDDENQQLNGLISEVNRKTEYYSYILNHLDQIGLMTDKKKL